MQATKALLAGLALAGASLGATGQTYPSRPVHLVVGFAPGGAADIVARAMSDAMGKSLGQTVVVDNKPGAGSSLAAEFVAKAPPDGYTVLIASPSSISVNPALSTKQSYKFSDLSPVLKLTTSPLVIAVHPAGPIQSVKDLIAAAKKAPGSINYATSGNGSAPHLGAALFSQVAGVQLFHVPFKGGAPAVQSVVAGDTQVTFATPPSVLGLVQGGRLRGLAVSSRERSPLVPDLPGMAEAGLPEYAIEFWYGLFVPANTPAAVTRRIFDAATMAMRQPAVKQALARDGTEVALSPSQEHFATFLAADNKFWVKLVKDAGVTTD
ncbi:MAG TPA: tripartite tricarboxylate transporter substrate binding protein [Ideonella sp.]|nr:tripartite tricarboxylate transporter substrate binding protein [Ideonella sp.]